MAIQTTFSFPFAVASHAFNKDETRVVICTDSNDALIYAKGPQGWTKEYVLKQHDLKVTAVDWAPESNRIVTCSQDKNSYVWTFDEALNEWKPTLVHLRFNRAATIVRWSPLENKFAVGGSSGVIGICYFGEGNDWWISKQIKKPIASSVLSLSWHPNNVLLACGGTDMTARVMSSFIKGLDEKPETTVWGDRLPFGTVCAEYTTRYSAWVRGVAFSPSGEQLAFVGHDSTITISSPAMNYFESFSTQYLPFTNVAWISEDQVAISGHEGAVITGSRAGDSWQFQSLAVKPVVQKTEAPESPTSSVAFNVFKQMDGRRTVDERAQSSASRSALITDMRVLRCNPLSVSTTSQDGKLVNWLLAA